jgi:hypothetical protein
VLACFRVVEGRLPLHAGHDHSADTGVASAVASAVPVAPAFKQLGTGTEVMKGTSGADTFSLGAKGLIYYLDPSGGSAKDGSYALIQNFGKGDKIQLVCDEMEDYSVLVYDMGDTVGISSYIYYNQSGGHVDLIACVTGPDALKLDLMDASTFIWDITPAAIDAVGGIANDILIGGDAADELIGRGGSDVIIGAMGADRLIGVDTQAVNPGRGEVDVLIGAPGADTFVLAGNASLYYLDPVGQSSKGYAAIQDFEKGDKIQLLGGKSDYVLQNCLIGVSSATCIYFNRDGSPGVGASDDLIATVQGPEALALNLGDTATFLWSQSGIAASLLSDYVDFNRFRDPITGIHSYSTAGAEATRLRSSGWQDEGLAWGLFSALGGEVGGLAEVHRLFNPLSNDHLLTLNDAEVSSAQKAGYIYEGVIGRAMQPPAGVSALTSVMRFSKEATGEHFYTASTGEAAGLAALGFRAEGVAWAV